MHHTNYWIRHLEKEKKADLTNDTTSTQTLTKAPSQLYCSNEARALCRPIFIVGPKDEGAREGRKKNRHRNRSMLTKLWKAINFERAPLITRGANVKTRGRSWSFSLFAASRSNKHGVTSVWRFFCVGRGTKGSWLSNEFAFNQDFRIFMRCRNSRCALSFFQSAGFACVVKIFFGAFAF